MTALNEALIRDVVAEVLGRLGQPSPPDLPSPACGCGNGQTRTHRATGGKYGVFQDANEACSAAHDAFLALKGKGVAARAKVVEIVKTLADSNAVPWGQ